MAAVEGAIGIDIGGTFTDVVYADASTGTLLVEKVASGTGNVHDAVRDGLTRLTGADGVDTTSVTTVVHGTTIATNALIEGRMSRTALIITAGFGDVLEIGTMLRPDAYRLTATRQTPAVARDDVIEVTERLDRNGQVLTPLTEGEIDRVVRELERREVQAIAVCLLFSHLNPEHERRLAAAITTALPHLAVVISSVADPEPREYVRANTTSICASLNPLVTRYVADCLELLDDIPGQQQMFIMQSNGGLLSPPEAPTNAHRLLMSGPAGGVIAAQRLAAAGRRNLITIDVGGTSSDLCLIVDGQPSIQVEPSPLDPYPIRTASLSIHAIGAGGGSIARVDDAVLRVGPRSAGSFPGPVCYARGGTEPTVTDAQLALGRLSPQGLLGGEMALDLLAARAAISEHIAAPLTTSWENAAAAIIEVAVASMERGLRTVSVHEGYDPQDFALVAYGGAGPLHACDLARAAGISTIVVPAASSTFSAVGLLYADLRQAFTDARPRPIETMNPQVLEEAFVELQAKAEHPTAAPANKTGPRWERFADLRYIGQRSTIRVELPPSMLTINDLVALFRCAHEREYGKYASERDPIEIAALRLIRVQDWRGDLAFRCQTSPSRQRSARDVFFTGAGWLNTPVIGRGALSAGDRIAGPAVLEDRESTILLTPDSWAELERDAVLIHLDTS